MKMSDIVLPHRLLLNQSLRKEADKLRGHIDEYQQRYDDQYQKNIEELDSERDRLNAEFEHAKEAVLGNLSSDVETLQAISDSIAAYVSAYFDRRLTYKKKEVNSVLLKLTNEYIGFLSDQMGEIGSEIEMLRARRELLSRDADVSDIIHLVSLSGCVLPVEDIRDAKSLLDHVNGRMDEVFDEDRIAWYSLLNVRTILEERVSFLSEIQYITWVIEQKIQLSKELKNYRDEQYRLQSKLLADSDQLQKEIDGLSSVLWEKAKEIRFYWARPIVFIGAEIEDNLSHIKELNGEIAELSEKKKSLYYNKADVQHDIERMKDEHSSDSYKWDRLQRERRDLSDEIKDIKSKINNAHSEIDTLKSDMEDLKSKRSTWNEKRKSIQDLLRDNSSPLIRIGANNQTDDAAYAENRLEELVAIEAEGKKAADIVYKKELERLVAEKDVVTEELGKVLAKIESRLSLAEKELQSAEEQLSINRGAALTKAKAATAEIERRLNEQLQAVESAKRVLSNLQATDKRFVLARLFSDTPEEIKAKANITAAHQKKQKIEAELDTAKSIVSSSDFSHVPEVAASLDVVNQAKERVALICSEKNNAELSYNSRIAELEKRIKSLKPVPERPTYEERSEMNKIQKWKAGQGKRPKRKEKR